MNFTIEKAINIVKLFITLGAEAFYTKYFVYGNKFTEQYRVSKKAMKEVLNNVRKADLDFKNGLITEEELDVETIKGIALAFMKDVENGTIEKQKPIRYVADLIIGQVVPMLVMITEIKETGNLQYETVAEIEEMIYDEMANVLCFYIKDEENEET